MKHLISIFSILFALGLSAQDYLYLHSERGLPEKRWKQGEYINLLIENGGESYWQKARFTGGDSLGIQFGTRYVPYKSILKVKTARGLVPFFSIASLSAAALFTGVFATNAIINEDRPILRPGQVGLGVGLAALGLGLRWFAYREYPIGKEYYFKIIRTD